MLNFDAAQIIMLQAYVSGANDAFGLRGQQALTTLFNAVRQVLTARPPELIARAFTVLVPIDPAAADSLMAVHGAPTLMTAADDVAVFMAGHLDHSIVVALAADHTYRAVATLSAIDPVTSAATAVVYHREAGIERILAGGHDDAVPRLSTISTSSFAEPTFSSLDDALDRYKQVATESGCQILAQVWEGGVDGPRLVLVNKPEGIMRDSLFQALSMGIRPAHVTREHTADATKRVDIHVAWIGSPAEAVIEIKWIGKSMNPSGGQNALFGFSASRAQKGASQLADYLDRKRSASTNHSVRGYLVVYDARRRKLKGPLTPIKRADALAFENADLNYSPDYSANRSDFAAPRRWFLRPRESSFLEAA